MRNNNKLGFTIVHLAFQQIYTDKNMIKTVQIGVNSAVVSTSGIRRYSKHLGPAIPLLAGYSRREHHTRIQEPGSDRASPCIFTLSCKIEGRVA
jgi:hypothetical protein